VIIFYLGPWLKILQATKTALQGKQGHIKLLDLASGPGEPGLTIAKEMPHVGSAYHPLLCLL
jgi:16S rRNA G527 N7-methylase RsmG